MDRRPSMVLAAYGAWNHVILLSLFDPMKRRLTGLLAPGREIGPVRVLGLSMDGFVVTDPGRVAGWLPQVVFVVAGGVLTYGVLRGARGLKPRLRTVLALNGAALLAAGLAVLIGPALDPQARSAFLTYNEWTGSARMGAVPAAAAQAALCVVWLTVFAWYLMWRYRHLPPVRRYLGIRDETGGEPAPLLERPIERRQLMWAGLIPAVLLAVAGGPVLRHSAQRYLEQDLSVTFDPALWDPYRPPLLVQEWSGVLYPALRLRPLSHETAGGWLATLTVCVVFLLALAPALRSVARHLTAGPEGRVTALRLVMNGWYATLLAAVVAAFVDGRLLQWSAPRVEAEQAELRPGLALGDAVRFGTAWGWTVGLACLVAVVLMRRHAGSRAARPGTEVDEEQPIDA
ncbi:hypothetical protein [uncultured Streptomyces sp.]|uniref:hypothetical protein n=1 Tax=uncultured Streptomyces sp. TaxID=174707 RepID=UPI0026341AA3|nr:hypothetical protein [uncultured Streptomyces sp.]